MLTEPHLTENARTIFDKRYARKDGEGGVTETPAQTIDRVVMNVASVNALYSPGSPDRTTDVPVQYEQFPARTARRQYEWLRKVGLGFGHGDDEDFGRWMSGGWAAAREQAERYREMLTAWDFLPNSPTWTGAGTPLGQLAACFVLPIDDDLATGRSSIFGTLRVAALIQQTGGGNGFSFGRLRPSGALVTRSMGKASGPVGFLRVFNAGFGEIGQGGTRRGANMGVLPVDHPDVFEFMRAKVVEGEIANFNISVAITDEFMEAVEKDAEFDLRWSPQRGGLTDDPVTYEVVHTVRARDLYDEIVRNAWVIGDPGNLFIDRANRDNPCPARYTLEATNPCGEQWLPPYSNCCLGSINLGNFVSWDGTFDWGRYAKTIHLAQNFLDDVIDANQYVPEVPELEEAAMGERRIGLGPMGLADAMFKLGIRYGSEEGVEFTSQVIEFMRFHTMLASIERAKQRGSFGWFDGSIYDLSSDEVIVGLDGKEHARWTPPTSLVPHVTDWGRPGVDWDHVVSGLRLYGIRNACQLTSAPTGTISNVAMLEGSGLEPGFALVYDRTLTQDEEKIVLSYASPLFHEALTRAGKTPEQIAEIVAAVKANGGSCQGVALVPDHIQHTFVVAADVPADGHIRTQAAAQRFVDNSISKTINLPNAATVEDVSTAYRLAYDLGCKGITVYRQGSREAEVLTTGAAKAVDDWPFVLPRPIPAYAEVSGLPTRTFPVATPFGTAQVYLTELAEYPGRPFDVRIGFGKAGNDKMADVEAIGRMISIALRAGVPVEKVVSQLEGIGGATITGFGDRRVRSVADGVGKLLRRLYLSEVEVGGGYTVNVETGDVRLSQSDDERRVGHVVSVAPGQALVVDPDRVCPKCHNATLVKQSGCTHCEVRLGGCGDYSGCD